MGFTLWQVPSQDHIQAEVQGEQKLWIKEASKETGKKKSLPITQSRSKRPWNPREKNQACPWAPAGHDSILI